MKTFFISFFLVCGFFWLHYVLSLSTKDRWQVAAGAGAGLLILGWAYLGVRYFP